MPFVKTIVNLTKQSSRHTPGLSLLVRDWRGDIAKGGAARDIALAENLTGAGLMMVGYMLAEAGLGTGAEPPDPEEAAAWRVENQAQSVQSSALGLDWLMKNQWVGYNRMDPLGSVLALGASIPTIAKDEDKVAAALETAKEILMNKTMMIGLADGFGALQSYSPTEGESKITKYAGGMASTVVPAAAGEVARYMDPYQRKQSAEGFLGRTMGRTPVLREMLAPSINVRGEKIPRQEFLGPDLISPFPSKPVVDTPDPVLAEMIKIGYVPKNLARVGNTKLTPQQASDYQEKARTTAWPMLTELVKSSDYKIATPEERKEMMSKTLADANKVAREALGLQPGEEEETQLDLVKAARKAEKKGTTKAGMTFAERIDIAGGSAPQADSPVTKQLERLKRGIAIPDWVKDLPADQQEKVLSDRWSRLERVAPSLAKMNDRAARSVVEKELNGWSRSWAKFRHGEADGPTTVKPKPAAKPKMSFEQKLDIAGGSADQRKDPLTQLLAKHKIGLTVPTWTKSLDKSERDEILADRWEMLQNCAATLPEDADVATAQTTFSRCKAKWSKKWKTRRDELKAEGND